MGYEHMTKKELIEEIEILKKQLEEYEKCSRKQKNRTIQIQNAEKDLAEEKERLTITLSSISEGVITTDTHGRVVLINKAAQELTGWTLEEARLKPLKDVFHIIDEKTRKVYKNPLKKALRPRGAAGLESYTILIARDGTERIISDSAAVIKDSEANVAGAVLVFRDITEKVRIGQEFMKASKIESIGVLAGGMAHDFNNILTIIMGNISIAKMYCSRGNTAKVMEALEDGEKAAIQAKDLTHQLLTFSRGGTPIIKTTDMGELLKSTVSLILRGSNIKCEFSIDNGLWKVEADSGQMSQVINNLVINSQQAMPQGGIIKVKAQNVVINNENLLPLEPGRYIRISIEDNGIGIPKENIKKIFDPYFTTKQKGNGLGLPTAFSIINRHRGHITVESEVGIGTTFSIYLPASQVERLEETHKDTSLIMGEGRVLVMDDEEGIRNVIGQMLNNLGYEAEFAHDGMEAVRIYKEALESFNPFDAVIMDLTIPGGVGGRETILKLKEIDPDVKAIVSSGYSNDDTMALYKSYGFKCVIAKPYNIEELSKVMKEVMD